jgi:hypothetical protein
VPTTSTEPRPVLAGLVLTVLLGGLVGCGGGGPDATSTTASPSDVGSTPGSDATRQVDVCAQVSEDEVAAVVGGAVTGTTIGTMCTFNPATGSPAPTVQLSTMSYLEEGGGLENAKAAVRESVAGIPEDISDLGDAAFVVVGSSLVDDRLQGTGGVLLGGTLAQVTVIWTDGLTPDDLRRLTLDLMALAASKG